MKSSKISGEAEVLKMIRKMNQKMIRNREVEVFFIVEINFFVLLQHRHPITRFENK